MENLVSVASTARYITKGVISENIRVVWFVFHGYGMTASRFIENFTCISDSETLIVAPEGTHRYYGKGTKGEVRCNWMTSDLRESDIDNNVNYLNLVLSELFKQGMPKSIKIGILGFSQGGPTSFRWASQLVLDIDLLISWGSDLPKDVYLVSKKQRKINASNIKLVVGSKDQYISSDELDDLIIDLHEEGVNFDFHTFEGTHELHEETIRYFHARLLDENMEY